LRIDHPACLRLRTSGQVLFPRTAEREEEAWERPGASFVTAPSTSFR